METKKFKLNLSGLEVDVSVLETANGSLLLFSQLVNKRVEIETVFLSGQMYDETEKTFKLKK